LMTMELPLAIPVEEAQNTLYAGKSLAFGALRSRGRLS